MRRLFNTFFVLILILIIALAGNYFYIQKSAEKHLFSSIENVPESKVAVLLGTSRYLSNGQRNLYFEYRMDAAAELHKAGKAEFILVSGDNSEKNYNEPVAMQEALIKRGIPKENIVLDYAGFRTLDSMVRAQKVFGQQKFIVVSQKFHNERAIFIARKRGIEAFGFNARDVNAAAGFKTKMREVLARAKMFLDLFVLNKQPKFLGEKVEVGK